MKIIFDERRKTFGVQLRTVNTTSKCDRQTSNGKQPVTDANGGRRNRTIPFRGRSVTLAANVKVMPENSEKPLYRETFFGQPLDEAHPSIANKLLSSFIAIFDKPATFWREKIVEPNRKKDFYYYHQKFKRVPTIDECFIDDAACIYEADEQFKRDRKVEDAILDILRMRVMQCYVYHGVTQAAKCDELKKEYKEYELNWFIKYGDMNMFMCTAVDAYMKQKHRMIIERRQRQKQEKGSRTE